MLMTILSSLPLLWEQRCCSAAKQHMRVVEIALQLYRAMENGRQKQVFLWLRESYGASYDIDLVRRLRTKAAV